MSEKDKARFDSKLEIPVDLNACWKWLGTHFANGYACFWWEGQDRLASRLAYKRWRGAFHGKHVLHHCDNPDCVNPRHLFLGTQSDNVQDMLAKGRGNKAHGDTHVCSKLTTAKVAEAKFRYSAGESYADLGRAYGVSLGAVRNAILGITWKAA